MSEVDLDSFADDDCSPWVYCYNCQGDGWLHGCIDDMCRGSYEAEECPSARLCPFCKGEGEIYRENV